MKLDKNSIAVTLIPTARWIVRNYPSSLLRDWLWGMLGWRSRDFLVEIDNITVSGNTSDIIQRYLYWFGIWEPNLRHFIMKSMEQTPNRTFIDVGANIGYFSALVAKNYPRAKVVSIEAFPTTIQKLMPTVNQNKLENIRIVPEAASDEEGTIELFFAGPSNEGATTSMKGKFKSIPVSTTCKPLSNLLADSELSDVRLIKIDVEGAEYEVIRGLLPKMSLLPLDAEIVVEISTESMEKCKSIFDAFDRLGYFAYRLENTYSAHSYLHPKAICAPIRLKTIPLTQTDVVFSRLDKEML